jgi:acyl dehydratase
MARGNYYEDFEVGATYAHRPGRTIGEADNTWFTLLTMNTHPIHFDAEYAKHTEFGRPLVVSTLTLSLLVGMSVSDMSRPCSTSASRNRGPTRASSASAPWGATSAARWCASSTARCWSCGAVIL